MDEQRALLDSLMGEDRDGDRPKPKKHFSDDNICKNYLCGMCLCEDFARTKHDFGECLLQHDEKCKAQWDALDNREKAKYGYQQLLYNELDKLMVELKRKIDSNTSRVEVVSAPVISQEDQTRLNELNDEIKEELTRSELLGEAGDVDGAQSAAAHADQLKITRTQLEEEANQKAMAAANRFGQQEVCPLSGVIINKEESRIRDHKNGRNYKAWCKAHEVYGQLKKALQEDNTRHSSRDRKEDNMRHSSRDRERDRDRDRDRHRPSRDAERERDRPSRDSERERERDRSSKSRNTSSRRSRSRERSRRERDKKFEDDLPLPPPPPKR